MTLKQWEIIFDALSIARDEIDGADGEGWEETEKLDDAVDALRMLSKDARKILKPESGTILLGFFVGIAITSFFVGWLFFHGLQ